jgi:hypothetical protein
MRENRLRTEHANWFTETRRAAAADEKKNA